MSSVIQKKEEFSFDVVEKLLKDEKAMKALDDSLEESMDFIAKGLFAVPFVALMFGSAEELKTKIKDTMMEFSKFGSQAKDITFADLKGQRYNLTSGGGDKSLSGLYTGDAEEKPKFMTSEANRFGYYLGTVDGKHIDSHNENSSFPGASMQKMMAGLLNMVMYKGTDQALTKKELEYLIGYQHHRKIPHGESSNVMMGVLRNCKNPRFPDRQAKVGCLAPKDNNKFARKYLDEIGISRNTSVGTVSRVGNRQTCKDVFKYLSLLWRTANGENTILKQKGHYDEAMAVFDTIRRKDYTFAARGNTINGKTVDRETYSMQKRFAEKLKQRGVNIKSIYGKGGLYKGALNYGLIINEKYILVIYTKFHNLKTNQTGGYTALKQSRQKMIDIGSYVLKKNSVTQSGYLRRHNHHDHGNAKAVVVNKKARNPYNSGKLVQGYNFHQKILDSGLFTTVAYRKDRQWAHPVLWNAMIDASQQVQLKYGNQYKLYIGDLSNQFGGKMSGHVSHQMGIDADIGFYSRKVPSPLQFHGALVYNPNKGATANKKRPRSKYGTLNQIATRRAMPKYFDLEMNAFYLNELFKNPKVYKVFLDTPLVLALEQWVLRNQPDGYRELQKAIATGKLKTGGLPGHHNHYHLRMHIPT